MKFEEWWEKNFPGRSYVNRYKCARLAWRAGQEEMRERAAVYLDSDKDCNFTGDDVRALPLEGDDE